MAGVKREAVEIDDAFVARAAPAAKAYTQFDSKLKGFGLRVFPTGVKSYVFEYRAPGKGRLASKSRMKIGSPAQMTAKQARAKATRENSRIQATDADPMRERRAAREAAAKAREEAEKAVADRVESIVELFLKKHLKQKARSSWAKEGERLLRKEVIPALGGKRLADVRRADVHKMLDGIVERGAPIIANRTLAIFRRLCNWAVERDIIAVSPVEKIKAPSEESSRERVLSDDEIRLAWQAFGVLGYPFGSMAKLLLLTAARRDEAASATWDEIDLEGKTWSIAGARTKNDEPHEIPLSDMTVGILAALPRADKRRDAKVFTTNGKTAASGFSKAKRRADALIADAVKDGEKLARWTYHDLRRTAASGMAKLGVAPHVIEAVLNHKSGKIKGVARVYNRYSYGPEKREALDAWARRVGEVLGLTEARSARP